MIITRILICFFGCIVSIVSCNPQILGNGLYPTFEPLKNGDFVFGELLRNNATIFDSKGEIKSKFTFGSIMITTIPTIKTLEDGNFLISWRELRNGEDTFIQKFDTQGIPMSQVTVIESNKYAFILLPSSITPLKDGGFVVMWHTAEKGVWTHENYTAYAQIFNADTTPRAEKVKVFENSNTFINFPAIVTVFSGDFVIFWSENLDNTSWKVYGQWYNCNGGESIKSLIYTGGSETIKIESAISLGNGDILLSWLTLQSQETTLFGQIITADGKVREAPFIIRKAKILNSLATHCAELKDKRFVFVWSEDSPTAIYFQMYVDSEHPFKDPVKVSLDVSAGKLGHPRIAPAQDGGFFIIWDHSWDLGKSAVYLQKYNSEGELLSSATKSMDQGFLPVTAHLLI